MLILQCAWRKLLMLLSSSPASTVEDSSYVCGRKFGATEFWQRCALIYFFCCYEKSRLHITQIHGSNSRHSGSTVVPKLGGSNYLTSALKIIWTEAKMPLNMYCRQFLHYKETVQIKLEIRQKDSKRCPILDRAADKLDIQYSQESPK